VKAYYYRSGQVAHPFGGNTIDCDQVNFTIPFPEGSQVRVVMMESHPGSTVVHQDIHVWAENPTPTGFFGCAKETNSHDGSHAPIAINYVAYLDDSFGTMSGSFRVPDGTASTLANKYCMTLSFSLPVAPTLLTAVVHLSTRESVMTWSEHVREDYAKICVWKEDNEVLNDVRVDYVLLTQLEAGQAHGVFDFGDHTTEQAVGTLTFPPSVSFSEAPLVVVSFDHRDEEQTPQTDLQTHDPANLWLEQIDVDSFVFVFSETGLTGAAHSGYVLNWMALPMDSESSVLSACAPGHRLDASGASDMCLGKYSVLDISCMLSIVLVFVTLFSQFEFCLILTLSFLILIPYQPVRWGRTVRG
jgi:hypothetical protein